ncbi:hypothetical protein GM921_15060 [Pedobacter sp. LMG 31464]|uniref:DUF3945 domain-containing protein n=1 Tax=Pedobacter planticolens TaxID=2679964 RepID=A0A923IW77_9SPHI|nr:hypothetical protein [Pedobacter planticolens]MBB2146821.1 hypothetical protein [Pedobacter planticolens]
MKTYSLLAFGEPIEIDRLVEEKRVKFVLELEGKDSGNLELSGYELHLPRDIITPPHFNNGTSTSEIEEMLKQIDFPTEVPENFMAFQDQDPAFHQLAMVFKEMDNLEFFMVDMIAEFGDCRENANIKEMTDSLLVKYGMGNGLEKYLLKMNEEYWRDKFYNIIPFPAELHIGAILNRISEPGALETLSSLVQGNPQNKLIMNLNNLENLREEMSNLGFKKELIEQMEEKMKANVADFKLYDSVEATRGRVDMTLSFKQSSQSDYYYLNKFEVCHEKGQPIKAGDKIMVLTQTEGADKGMTKVFVHVSEAIAFFNGQKEMFKEQNGVSNLVIGKDANSAVKLATMENGKVNYIQKEFGQTYRTSPINQTIYVEKGKGFSAEQAVNLIQGRAVYRDDMVSQAGQQYKAWIKLDFDVPKDRFGNFMINQYTDPAYGFDLSKVLDKFEIKELGDPAKRVILEGSIRNGNRALVTVEKNGEPVKLELEAVPRYSQINLYTKEGRPEKREQFLKQPDMKQEYAQSRNKAQEKNKKQGQGLGV